MKKTKYNRQNGFSLGALLGALCVGSAFGGLTLPGCGDAGTDHTDPEKLGSVELALQPTPGKVVASIDYEITGQGSSFHQAGTVDLQGSTRLSFVIGGLPPGDYDIKITAKVVGATTTCSGAAKFRVVAGSTTAVPVSLRCQESPRTGGVNVNGTFNFCPTIDAPTVKPSEATVGSAIVIAAGAHDTDEGPKNLSFEWSASGGVLGNASAQTTTYRCTEPGQQHLVVKVSDGDPACDVTASTEITCTQPCPLEDGDLCSVDTCEADGTTSHTPTPWEGCAKAVEGLDTSCTAPVTDVAIPMLELCATALADALANAEQDGDVDAAMREYQACGREAVGCGNPSGEEARHRHFTILNSSICMQTAFRACRQKAREQFLQIDAPACVALAVLTSAATPPIGYINFQRCMIVAAAKEVLTVTKCARDNSCKPPQICVAEKCVDPGIEVLSATYGGNCGVPTGNVTSAVAGLCNGALDCNVFVHNSVLSDPRYGCPKDFVATWRCGSDVRTASHDAVANEGYNVPLSCR